MHLYAIDIEIDDSSESSSGENSDDGAGESSDSDLFFSTWYVTRRNRTYHVEKQFYVVRACE